MCGIAGIIAPNAARYRTALHQMTDALAHRGPDGEHHEILQNAILGHRRLAIVDLSDAAKQPMFSDTRNECIVFNGEIYGYQVLKKNYTDYFFRSASDTELILAMYQKHGKNLLDELPGMFAFAIWDEEKQELFCARDRFGEKPFFYTRGKNGEFIFGSEIKAILATDLVEPIINENAVSHYLKYGYVSAHESIYRNISALPPAHFLEFSNGNIHTERYYALPKNDFEISLTEAREEFSHLLKNAVQKQLVADVEVGSFLSGGLDSSTIVAMVSDIKQKQTTISFGYSGENSELRFAEEIARKYHTNHIEILENRGNIASELLKISPFLDEPFADMSYTPQFKICEAAARHLKVVLSGDVGDELFGGYHFYTVADEMKNHFSYQNLMAKFILKIVAKLKQTSYISNQNQRFKSIFDFHQNGVRNYFNDQEINLFGYQKTRMQDFSFVPDPNSLNDIMRIDLEKYVPGNMLLKADRMAMANSLEVRTPFLDKDFAEFCIQLPENLKVKGNSDKIILRAAMAEYWTENIRNRRKQGFGTPVKNWFEEKPLLDLSSDLLQNRNSAVFSILDFGATQQFLNKDEKHWNLLQLALWAENLKTKFKAKSLSSR